MVFILGVPIFGNFTVSCSNVYSYNGTIITELITAEDDKLLPTAGKAIIKDKVIKQNRIWF